MAAWLAGLGLGGVFATLVLYALVSREVTILHRVHGPAEREAWRAALGDPRDDIAETYGMPEAGGPVRVMLWSPRGLIVPREQPGRLLLHVDRPGGEDVLTGARFLLVGLGASGTLLVAGLLAARRGRSVAPGQ